MSHEEAHELLPWFVNGSLAGAEKARVSAHVDVCLQCRRSVQRDRQLLARMSAEPVADSAIEAGFRKLMRRIDHPRQAPTQRFGVPDRASAPNTWAYAALMLGALAIALWLAVPRDHVDTSPPFTTVITGQAPQPNQLDVVFAAEIDAAGRAAIAARVGARIVAGPSEAGRYVLELDPDTSPIAIERALEGLRGEASVQFAGRAYAGDD